MKKPIRYFLATALFLVIWLGIYIVTYPKIISWEVVSEENKAKYIEVLNKQHIPFSEETDHLGRKWVTVRGYNMEEYEKLIKEYTEWYNSYPNTREKSKQ